MPSKHANRKTVAGVAAVFFLLAVLWLWRDPMLMVRGAFAAQRWWIGLSSRQVEAGGHRWVYAERDAVNPDAPTLVMVHGFTGSKENWYPMAERLGGHYRLIVPDLPGWGASERKAGEDYGFLAQSARLAEFVEKIRTPGSDVVLLGHSMGGGIIAVTAADHPQAIARVGLFDAAGVRFKDNRFGEQVVAGENPFAVYDDASLKRYIDTVFYGADAKPSLPWPISRAVIGWRKRQAPFEQAVLERIGRGEERFMPGKAATAINQPALLLWCRQDAVIDFSAMALYAERMPQALQVTLDECGHMSIMEKPDDAAAAVELLIKRGVPR
jgi:pimeloyl-ACP methyl ester carboxylesterase